MALYRQHDIEDDSLIESSKQDESTGHGCLSDTESWDRQDPDLRGVFPGTISDDIESEENSNTDACAIAPSSDSTTELELGRAIRRPTRHMPVFAPVRTPLQEKARQFEVVLHKKQIQDKECQTDLVNFTESVKIITTWRKEKRSVTLVTDIMGDLCLLF